MSYAAYHVVCDGITMEGGAELEPMRTAFEEQKQYSGYVELRGYPTWSEYERTWRSNNCECTCYCDEYGLDNCFCFCEETECQRPAKYDTIASWDRGN